MRPRGRIKSLDDSAAVRFRLGVCRDFLLFVHHLPCPNLQGTQCHVASCYVSPLLVMSRATGQRALLLLPAIIAPFPRLNGIALRPHPATPLPSLLLHLDQRSIAQIPLVGGVGPGQTHRDEFAVDVNRASVEVADGPAVAVLIDTADGDVRRTEQLRRQPMLRGDAKRLARFAIAVAHLGRINACQANVLLPSPHGHRVAIEHPLNGDVLSGGIAFGMSPRAQQQQGQRAAAITATRPTAPFIG